MFLDEHEIRLKDDETSHVHVYFSLIRNSSGRAPLEDARVRLDYTSISQNSIVSEYHYNVVLRQFDLPGRVPCLFQAMPVLPFAMHMLSITSLLMS